MIHDNQFPFDARRKIRSNTVFLSCYTTNIKDYALAEAGAFYICGRCDNAASRKRGYKDCSPIVALQALRMPSHTDSGNSLHSMDGFPWAADNAAFSGFDESKYMRMLQKIRDARPIFVTVPDIVADAEQTLQLFEKWQPMIKSYGLPTALVLQDGQENLPVPWDKIDAVFIGGTTEWKLGKQAYKLAKEAKKRGKWIHMGRA